MKVLLKMVLSLIVGAVAVVLSLYAGFYGARAGGMEDGGWGWQFYPTMIVGTCASLFASLIYGLAYMFREGLDFKFLLGALGAPPTCVFLGSVIYGFFAGS